MFTRRAKIIAAVLWVGTLVVLNSRLPSEESMIRAGSDQPTQLVRHFEDGSSCYYNADGSGWCQGPDSDDLPELIPALVEYDADFCNDVDPKGEVITLCKGRNG